MLFVINKIVNVIFLSEPWRLIVFMLPNALNEIASDTDVERTVFLAGKHINARLFAHKLTCMDSRLRGNDDLVCERNIGPGLNLVSSFLRHSAAYILAGVRGNDVSGFV